MSEKRESSYDLLRIISALAVIMIHVSTSYKSAITNVSIFGHLYDRHIISILIYNTLSRFCVPCFIMISGAFLLMDDRNLEYKFLYKKCVKKIVVPTVIFSVLYFLYSEVTTCINIVTQGEDLSTILSPVKNLIIGEPYYHMWYMYTIIGIYLLIPLILKFKKSIGEDAFFKISIVVLIIASISGWTSKFEIHWGIPKVVCYMGYLMIGYQFRRHSVNKKNNRIGTLLIMLGIVVELILAYIQYEHILMGLGEADEKYSLVGSFNPLVVIASLLIFAGFSRLNINFNLSKLSSHTFYIYLFHAGVWSVLWNVLKRMGLVDDARIVIPICILLVFVLSWLCSIIYTKLWREIERKYLVSDRICKLLKLE